MKEEVTFNGSQLETEIRNTSDSNKLKKLHQLTKSAFENQAKSIFWKQAFQMIDKKHKTKCT